MKYVNPIVIALSLVLGACAQVPKESVELSATVGRDIAEIRKSHIALVDLYYAALFTDINKFVDDVYLPFQIHKTLTDELDHFFIARPHHFPLRGLQQKEHFVNCALAIIFIQRFRPLNQGLDFG